MKQKQFHHEEAKILVTAEEQEIFDQHADELQKHPSVRKMQYTLMWQALKVAGAIDSKEKANRPKKALMKNHKKSERIKVAKLEISEEKRAKALQYMKRKPGSKDAVEGGKSQKHEAILKKKNEEEEAAALDPAPQQFYGCSRCRWRWKGCCYCNPMKHEILLERNQ